MTIICPKCSLQLEVTGASTRPVGVRCPKCNTTVNAGTVSPASEKSGLTVGQSPATERPRFQGFKPAALFQPKRDETESPVGPAASEEMSRLLLSLLRQDDKSGKVAPSARPAWNPRKALVCTAEQYREPIALQLAGNGYQVFVAQNTGQAIDRMRENQLDVVLLDPEFDADEQGAAFVMREVNVLRPAERRRLFFVMLSPAQRTMESHSAFLNNVNAIVNTREIEDLSRILDHSLREFNELYKEFNLALKMPAL